MTNNINSLILLSFVSVGIINFGTQLEISICTHVTLRRKDRERLNVCCGRLERQTERES